MKKFLALYMAPVSVLDEMMQTPKEEQEKGMGEWTKWMEEHKANISEMGAPLGKNMRVTSEDSSMERNEAAGYSVITADSHADAAEIFKDNPHLTHPGTWIDLVEILEMDEQ